MQKILLLLLSLICALGSNAQGVYASANNGIMHEVRAVWLTTLMGLDWPSRPANNAEDTAAQKKELCNMLDKLKAVGINTVLFQARIRSTTAYESAYEPWDGIFTGKSGKTPLYDPLAFAIDECHKRNMECHAWVVAFPICKVAIAKQLGKRALPAIQPKLCQRCGDQWMMDPGVPQTATYLANICKEIATKYNVDGIHLDYIRYPEKGIPFNDNLTYKLYGNGIDKTTWRKSNIDRCVRCIHDSIKKVRPWIKLSCSPIGKYADLSRYSSFGWNARDAVSQNAQLWLKKGWMDMLFPMMYFDNNHFYPFLADWKENDCNRPIVPGLGIYFLNTHEKNWPLITIQRQLNVIRANRLGGYAFFRAKFLLNNEKGLYDWLKNQFNANDALVPPMTWQDSIRPPQPQVTIQICAPNISISWNNVQKGIVPIYYNIYRKDSVMGNKLVAQHLTTTHYSFRPSLPALLHSQYVVKAIDAYGNESEE